ncbi:MAG: small subunit ribosomal protein S4 [Puniceicoccaceae bacterium 5H]|nr:MAG: small subunit ribosomal protein S4 [Puniceicoccaceae bacterium 5H]
MARYTGPATRINRKYGMSVFPASKAQERKPHPPGQHGPRMRRNKQSEYSVGLAEKQKLRYMYGLTEKQFRRTFETAKSKIGVTSEIFTQMLERRLDSVVYACGFAKTRRQARQFVTHGHVKVNGRKTDVPSCQISAGDVVEVRESTSSRQLATRAIEDTRVRTVPLWMSRNEDQLTTTINRLPSADDIETGVNVQLIVEFYSR